MTDNCIQIKAKFGGTKDMDIYWILQQYSFKEIIIFVVRRYLHRMPDTIPLPNPTSLSRNNHWKSATIHQLETPDVYDFLRTVKDNCMTELLKRLIRASMDTLDIRDLVNDSPEATRIPQYQNVQQPLFHAPQPKPKKQHEQSHNPSKSPTKTNERPKPKPTNNKSATPSPTPVTQTNKPTNDDPYWSMI